MHSLKDKVVIITGASSGIGLACAKELFAHGAKLVLASRNIDALENLANQLNIDSKQAIAVKTDVTIEEDCKRLINTTLENFGRIDILINNAGISMRASFADVKVEVLKRLMDVNFWGTVYCTKYAYPYLIQTKGSLVGISSVAGIHGLPGRTGYSASKFAMQGLLDTIRIETLKKGLHVMVAIPTFTASNVRFSALTADGSTQGETPRDEGKMMSAEETAMRIIKGIRKRKRMLTMSVAGRLTPFVRMFFLNFVDNLYYKQMKKEPDSPI
ncbi:MAG: SDR family oxidoreductase [Prevotellaceae bacterium]|jgi:NADP-dependent 3-hydroxy acid dehydrogenase YdfG|nr:SDR family oxidoreductase [Prevotellaceae bacterium]